MFSTASQIIFLSSLLIASAVVGQGVIGRTDTIVSGGHRIDANTAGVLSVMPKSLHDDLVLWQTFSYSDNSDADFYDLSDGGDDGAQTTASQQPTFSSSNGGVYEFDGVDDFIELSADGTGTFDLQAITVAIWFESPASWGAGNGDYFPLFCYDKTSHSNPYYSHHLRYTWGDAGHAGWPYWAWNNGSSHRWVNVTAAGPLGQWVHVVCVYESGRQEIWQNGLLSGSSANTDTITFYAQETWLGKSNFATTKALDISEIMVFDRALTAAEILAIGNRTGSTYYPYFDNALFDFDMWINDLVLWLPFDSDETPDYIDKGPIGNDGAQATASEQPTFSSSDGGVYDFDGVDDSISIAASTSLNAIGNLMAITAWVKLEAHGWQMILIKGTGAAHPIPFQFSLNPDGDLNFYQSEGAGFGTVISGTVPVPTNQWTFVAAVNDSSDAFTYINAVQADTDATPATAVDTDTETLGLGANVVAGSSFIDGFLDDVRIYDRGITAAEVLAIYNNTKATYGL
jgi:hypothetical protein